VDAGPIVDEPVVRPIADAGKPDAATAATMVGAARQDRPDAGEVEPGPDDCWAPDDVVELQLEARGFPVKGLRFEGPDCDDELEAAVERGDLAAVRRLIEEVRIPEHWPARSPRCRTEQLGSLLHLCANGGSTQVAEYLISKGVNVRGCDFQGSTPLHVAAANLHLALVRLLVEKGARVDAVDLEGRRPLHRCFDNRHLLPARANVDSKHREAAEEIARFLVGAGARDLQNWIPER
jgi:hypothetical protein